MKNTIYPIVCLLLMTVSCSTPMQTTVSVRETVPPPRPAPPPVMQTESTYQVFYDELSPFGRWITYPGVGYVWSPSVEPGFQPYATNGHWVYSNAGWTWFSNYHWGWAAFHYGRWFYEEGYGWLWLPGHEWAPAWVTWGHSGAYYGWAPLGPKIHAGDEWSPPARSWTFVPQEHINKPNIEVYIANRSSNVTIVKNVTIINNRTTNVVNNNTTVINNNQHINTVYNTGPHVNEVEKVTNVRVQQMNINEHNKPAPAAINNNNLYMYRPAIMHEERQQQLQNNKPEPKKFEQYRIK